MTRDQLLQWAKENNKSPQDLSIKNIHPASEIECNRQLDVTIKPALAQMKNSEPKLTQAQKQALLHKGMTDYAKRELERIRTTNALITRPFDYQVELSDSPYTSNIYLPKK
jgi:DNA-binding TFAR19-related protein (PDSD5 family)